MSKAQIYSRICDFKTERIYSLLQVFFKNNRLNAALLKLALHLKSGPQIYTQLTVPQVSLIRACGVFTLNTVDVVLTTVYTEGKF